MSIIFYCNYIIIGSETKLAIIVSANEQYFSIYKSFYIFKTIYLLI